MHSATRLKLQNRQEYYACFNTLKVGHCDNKFVAFQFQFSWSQVKGPETFTMQVSNKHSLLGITPRNVGVERACPGLIKLGFYAALAISANHKKGHQK